MRLGLQMLNLTMGDTLRFSNQSDDDDETTETGPVLAAGVTLLQGLERVLCFLSVGQKSDPPLVVKATDSLSQNELAATLHQRGFEMLAFAVIYGLFAACAAVYSKSADRTTSTAAASNLFASLALMLMAALLTASLWTHAPWCRRLLASPIVGQVHLLLQIVRFGSRAPPFLTLTDGGLTENMGVVELLRRHMRWIVVVDTTEDIFLDFNYLKASLDMAQTTDKVITHVCDAGASARPLEEVLSKRAATRPFEKLRATYQGGGVCDIFIIKMKKPAQGCGGKCQPLVGAREVATGVSDAAMKLVQPALSDLSINPPDLRQDEINGVCADCCHVNCACLPCGQFPFLGVGNQFLTPIQFANLARLGRDLADAPLKELRAMRSAV
mmetsp:Transcript_27880/g.96359  ORF Transcript_27880/g.96359 Transcript_27880/m.96359 type:complete len:384 (-) Transcript_27880:107-1258(-)